jgi:phospholipid-binding lipoprotein MlaA
MRRWMLIGAAAASLMAPAVWAQEAPAPQSPPDAVSDPWIKLNRANFAVHEAVDKAALGPIAKGYRTVTPKFFRTGVNNLLDNLAAPTTFANDVLQGEGGRAGKTFGRFVINTTIGVGGLFDPATSLGLDQHKEDFGQTLARWGVPSGPYLFVPLRGPTNVRDLLASPVDLATNPLAYVKSGDDDVAPLTVAGVVGALAAREELIDQIETLRTSPDPYISYRSFATIAREAAIANGRDTTQELPDYGVEPPPPAK